MMLPVPLSIRRSIEACTIASLSPSSALVASSKTSMRGFMSMARAIAIRCLWPPDICAPPRSPTCVSYFIGKDIMNSCALAAMLASTMASSNLSALSDRVASCMP
mmetsp:Transcript_61156/g.111868  ORF Transcript_61156/g.111868 Transcript_61156/m.111868 type:complete len:105 (-) Transcript_61156:509-823(-)